MDSNPKKDLPIGNNPKYIRAMEETIRESNEYLRHLRQILYEWNQFNANAKAFVDNFLRNNKS